jgi:hypothetical protein
MVLLGYLLVPEIIHGVAPEIFLLTPVKLENCRRTFAVCVTVFLKIQQSKLERCLLNNYGDQALCCVNVSGCELTWNIIFF